MTRSGTGEEHAARIVRSAVLALTKSLLWGLRPPVVRWQYMSTKPPVDQQRKLDAAADALVLALRTVPWGAARVTFSVQAERVHLSGLDFFPHDVVALARFDPTSTLPVADALTALWRRSGPEGWSSGTLVVRRGKNPIDIDATVELR